MTIESGGYINVRASRGLIESSNNKVVEKVGDNGWVIERTEAMDEQRRKSHVDNTIFHSGF